MAARTPTTGTFDQRSQGTADQRSAGGEVPELDQRARTGGATTMGPEKLEANQLPPVFSKFVPLDEG